MNILQCESCKMALIEEEAAEHKCRKFKDIWATPERQFWIGDDSGQYYPLSPTKLQQPNKTPDDCNTTKSLVVLR